MRTILLAFVAAAGIVGCGAAYAGVDGACAGAGDVTRTYARPDEPKRSPRSSGLIQEAKVQPKVQPQTYHRQPTGIMQPARKIACQPSMSATRTSWVHPRSAIGNFVRIQQTHGEYKLRVIRPPEHISRMPIIRPTDHSRMPVLTPNGM